jgi:hydroxymethylpyrimidine pyrophosphatase-like HAD family hydrolase
VFDIDGCLSRGSFSHFSADMIMRLREVSAKAACDPLYPAITVCTGRPQPYVECFLQMIGSTMPALCEGGTVLFDPHTHGVYTHRDFGLREERLLEALRHEVEHELVNEAVMFEPGKVTHLTLLVIPPLTPEQLLPAALAISQRFGPEFIVETTRICVHFLFRHLHKGTGVAWLSERTGIAPDEMAGMGDARPDVSFLEMVGIAGAPANAHHDVKAVAHFVSQKSDAEGALEFIDWILAHNHRFYENGGPPHN